MVAKIYYFNNTKFLGKIEKKKEEICVLQLCAAPQILKIGNIHYVYFLLKGLYASMIGKNRVFELFYCAIFSHPVYTAVLKTNKLMIINEKPPNKI